MEQAVKATYSKEELANSPEEDHDHGEHFVMIEEWESIQDRINFGRNDGKHGEIVLDGFGFKKMGRDEVQWRLDAGATIEDLRNEAEGDEP